MATATKLVATFRNTFVDGKPVCRNCGGFIHNGEGVLVHKANDLAECKNLCRKEVRAYGHVQEIVYEMAYEVWENVSAGWRYYVLAKRQIDDHKPYAIWLCACQSPYESDMAGHDTYADDVRSHCVRVK